MIISSILFVFYIMFCYTKACVDRDHVRDCISILYVF